MGIYFTFLPAYFIENYSSGTDKLPIQQNQDDFSKKVDFFVGKFTSMYLMKRKMSTQKVGQENTGQIGLSKENGLKVRSGKGEWLEGEAWKKRMDGR